MVVANPVKNILQSYLRRLTNLSGNNRSLLLLRLAAEQLMDLHEVNSLNGYPSFEVLKALIGSKTIKICQVLDSRVEFNNEVSKKLKKIQRVDNLLFEERGTFDLHIGWPFVRGKFSDGTFVRCPLLFFPVSIVQENNGWYLQLRQQAGITFNKSFLLAYSFYNKVSLEEEMLDTSFEDFNTDTTVFRTQLYQLLKEKLEINFNPDNFRDELIPFQQFKKEEFDLKHRNGELKLFPEAVLGIFPQAGSQLVPDYLKLIEENNILDLEDFFIQKNLPAGEGTGVEKILAQQVLKEEKIHTPFTLDAYQENAIQAVKSGQSIVVQGPPGTGKSQLICNLMADAIASGKRALLVCQKRAALDVVYNRLQEKQLGDFVGLVHDFRNERKMIFNKIARQIDGIEDYKSFNRSLDVIQMERRFFQVCRSIDRITEEFESFKKTLFDDQECGLSVKELYLTSDIQGDTINIRQEYQHFPFTTLAPFLKTLAQYAAYAAFFEQPDYAWRNRCSFSGYQLHDRKSIEQVIREIPAYQKETQDKIKDLINVVLNLEEADSFRAREDDALGMIALVKTEAIFKYMQAMADEKDNETSFLWFTNVERVLMNCFTGAGPEIFLHADQLVKFQEALQKKMKTRGNLFRTIRWLFSKDKQWINDVLEADGLPNNKKGLRLLEEKIDNRLNLEHHLTAVKKKSWLIDLPADYDEVKLKTWFTRQKLAIRAKLIFNSLREVKEGLHPKKYTRTSFISMLNELLDIVGTLKEKKKEWLKYITPFQFRFLVSNPEKEEVYLKTLRKDFESLCDFDRIRENLATPEKDTLNKLYDKVGAWDQQALEKLLQNSLRLAWIEHIEAKNPDLRSVSSKKMEQQREELMALVEEKQKLSHDILLLRARERVYENLEYNRLNNRVTYRDLYHQVTKKKKIWPLRKLITDFQQEIFNVMPCWMVSPEATSAIFPMTEIFDLVIFDEASQCFSERGIPAMYRGRQMVVAGDDMQLKPNELYQSRWEEGGDHPDLEVDSLLDLAKRYLPTVHLQGHYRSKSLELIDFSNKHFYEGRLQLLPDRKILNEQQPAIEYHRVDGVWENNTNMAEANVVVERVLNLLKEDPDKQIGVVTFNAPQQNLILDLLEERFAKERMVLPQTLFVKNIENVQGDEKDIIIFSVGYAPDKVKKKMNMQFGSLNQTGGENRLNVAVTRAREKIILICSIEPEQLHTEDLKNEGPRLLKKYLEFAREVYQRQFIPTVYENRKQQTTWYLNQQIKNWGEVKFPDFKFEVNSLPLADVHIKNNHAYLGIVLTDDMHYFNSLSEKDFFAYTPALMTRKNWDYHYVFSRNLWQDKEKVEEDLLRFIGTRIAE